MGSEKVTPFQAAASLVVVRFADHRQAGRRIAGVAAAARIVRELAMAGIQEAWLVLPGEAYLDTAAKADIDRLAGPLLVRFVAERDLAALVAPLRERPPELPGNVLIPAQALRAALGASPERLRAIGIPLEGDAVTRRILRQTGKAGDGIVSRWINRPLSRRLSAILLQVPEIRPIHATAATAAVGAAMFGALVSGTHWAVLVGALLFQTASVVDGVDGEIARATFRSSSAGAFLDSMVDVATNLLFILGLTIALATRHNRSLALLGGWDLLVVAAGLSVIAFASRRGDRAMNLDLVKERSKERFSGGLLAGLMRFATIISSRDFLAFFFLLMILAGAAKAILYLLALGTAIWFMVVVATAGGAGLGLDRGLAEPAAPDPA